MIGFYFLLIFLNQAHAVFYQHDNLKFLNESKDQKLLDLGKSVSAMINKKMLINLNDTSGTILVSQKSLENFQNICPDFKRSEFSSISNCTGLLIDRNKILTAGHCVRDESACKNNVWVFNYNSPIKYFKKNDIYNCKRIIFSKIMEDKTSIDFSLIELDRTIENDKNVAIKLQENPAIRGERMLVIGHPLGLPKTIASNAKVRGVSEELMGNTISSVFLQQHYFYIDSDTFSGNSGSPVFNEKTLELEGILVAGAADFELVQNKKTGKECKELIIKSSPNWQANEKVLRIQMIKQILLKNHINI